MYKTKYRAAFQSDKQFPFFMLWKEYLEEGKVVYASVIFSTHWRFEKI